MHFTYAFVLIISILSSPTVFAERAALMLSLGSSHVNLVLPFGVPVEAYDPNLDYDDAVIDAGLNFFERCVVAAQVRSGTRLVVPDWRALMGLSLWVTRFHEALKTDELPFHLDAAFVRRFLAAAREPTGVNNSFPEELDRHAYRGLLNLPTLKDLARQSVFALAYAEHPDFTAWLTAQVAGLPPTLFRSYTTFFTHHFDFAGGNAADSFIFAEACAVTLAGDASSPADNVIPFPRGRSPGIRP